MGDLVRQIFRHRHGWGGRLILQIADVRTQTVQFIPSGEYGTEERIGRWRDATVADLRFTNDASEPAPIEAPPHD